MPYYAQIDSNTNQVSRVIRCETLEWCENTFGGKWVRTYYSTPGKNFAGKGYIYHPERENFSTPQRYPSWTLDEQCHWQPPVPYPDDGGYYRWDEESQSWISSGGI